eukprot:165068-Hanusia_phi.AAC.1
MCIRDRPLGFSPPRRANLFGPGPLCRAHWLHRRTQCQGPILGAAVPGTTVPYPVLYYLSQDRPVASVIPAAAAPAARTLTVRKLSCTR